ncbi:MAG: 4Fe-4S dicluster domain-containing protein [Desulfohalobiaceae bacterium]|nr:4Fe-4S dicluster domain-containing protein [Desulfohalobiaceae bacterium]
MQLRAIHENCSGCRTCLLACSIVNFEETNPAKSVLRIEGLFPDPGRYRVRLCNQCGLCAEACPVEAISEQDGIYRVDEELCTQCLECVKACPQGVMRTHTGLQTPFKCTLCQECVEACPRGAIFIE